MAWRRDGSRWRLLEVETDPLGRLYRDLERDESRSVEYRRHWRGRVRKEDRMYGIDEERRRAAIAIRHEMLLEDPETTREEKLSGYPRLFGMLRSLGQLSRRWKGATVGPEPGKARDIRRALPIGPAGPGRAAAPDDELDDDAQDDGGEAEAQVGDDVA